MYGLHEGLGSRWTRSSEQAYRNVWRSYAIMITSSSQVDRGNHHEAFRVRDCALVALATGLSAQNLREFRDGLQRVHEGSIYHHFWGRFLQPQFDEPEYNNDFASWIYHGLHEKALAERLSVIDPTEYEDISSLREDILERVEERLDETEFVAWARVDEQFHFVRSQIVVLDTGKIIEQPEGLAKAVSEMSLGSIFYHFIDARRRTPEKIDDFSAWLLGWGEKYDTLRYSLMAIDPFFSSLKELRRIITSAALLHLGEEAGHE